MPRNQRKVMMPAKFFAAVTNKVQEPNPNIISGKTRFGPYCLPRMPKNGAVST